MVPKKTMKQICDMCGTKIEGGKCDCGTWQTPEESKDNPFLLAMEKFHEMRQFTLTSDAPHLGCAFIFFRGDYCDCEELRKFIYERKKRPFYE